MTAKTPSSFSAGIPPMLSVWAICATVAFLAMVFERNAKGIGRVIGEAVSNKFYTIIDPVNFDHTKENSGINTPPKPPFR